MRSRAAVLHRTHQEWQVEESEVDTDLPLGAVALDELITNRDTLDEIDDGYQAMRHGTNIRGVVVHG